MAQIAALAALIGGVALTVLPADAPGAYGAKRAGCEVTKPAEDGWIKQNGLRFPAGETATYAAQPPEERHEPPGTYPLDIEWDGSLAGKVPWFRDSRAYGDLKVRGTHMPGGERMRGHYDNHLGPESEVVPGALVFPRKGCWQITASSGDATLEATVWVIRRD
jgi:hypothetical protein